MCNQQEYVDFDKVNNIIINENKNWTSNVDIWKLFF